MSYLNTSFSYCGGRPDTFQILCHTRLAPRQNFDRPFERTTTCVFVAISQQKRLTIGLIIRCPKQETNPSPTQRASRSPKPPPYSKQKNGQLIKAVRFVSGKRDSNSRPQPWQGCALPTELFPQLYVSPPIPCRGWKHLSETAEPPFRARLCSTKLSYFRNYMFRPPTPCSGWKHLSETAEPPFRARLCSTN